MLNSSVNCIDLSDAEVCTELRATETKTLESDDEIPENDEGELIETPTYATAIQSLENARKYLVRGVENYDALYNLQVVVQQC